ncbi:hypothetical protein [Allochromatium palmeri]
MRLKADTQTPNTDDLDAQVLQDVQSQFPSPLDRRHRVIVILLIGGLLILPVVMARSSLDADTQALLVEAVEAAADLDAYHARCRGDGSGRRLENLSKLIVGKLRTTVLTVQDDLFPERNYRRTQERLERDFVERLQAAGGCQGAKDSTLPEELRQRYEAALESIQQLP